MKNVESMRLGMFGSASPISDVSEEYSYFLLLPSLIKEMKNPDESLSEVIALVKTKYLDKGVYPSIVNLTKRHLTAYPAQVILGLSASWHLDANGIPYTLRPLAPSYTWQPLVKNEEIFMVPREISGKSHPMIIRNLCSSTP